MRRLLIILFALAGVLPVPSGAQTHTARVAVLTPYPNQSAASLWRVFTDALGERGWVEGCNITFGVRETEGRPEGARRKPSASLRSIGMDHAFGDLGFESLLGQPRQLV